MDVLRCESALLNHPVDVTLTARITGSPVLVQLAGGAGTMSGVVRMPSVTTTSSSSCAPALAVDSTAAPDAGVESIATPAGAAGVAHPSEPQVRSTVAPPCVATRRVRFVNHSPHDVAVRWECYSIDPNDTKLVDFVLSTEVSGYSMH